ncbi:MAG: PEP-CTERM sorting domain-containing protein [Akkermansiaceae bacterium]
MKTTSRIITTLALLCPLSCGAAISLANLSSETPDETYSAGTITGSTVDASYSTSDVTFAFTADFGTVSAGGRVFFEFGGGAGTGTSLIVRPNGSDYEILFQHENGVNQIGGNGSSLIALVSPDTDDVEIVASLGFTSGTEATLNLFVGGALVGSETGLSTDWAGANDGGFDATGGGSILAADFSNQPSFPGASTKDITYDTGLQLYSGVYVNAVPEPASVSLLGLGGIAFLLRRRK